MESKLLLSVILLFSSCVFMGSSQAIGGVPSDSMPCVQKLLPCKPYLQSPAPPPSCCVPLKEMVADDSKCLCEIFNNPEILKGLNITQEDALKVPKACGAKADISVCKKVATPPASSPETAASPEYCDSESKIIAEKLGSSSNSTETPATKSSSHGISHFSGYGFIIFFMSLIIAAF